MSANLRDLNTNNYTVEMPKTVTSPVSNPVVSPAPLYQVKPLTVREMVVRRINKTLCICLLLTIAVTFVSYYIAMNFEAKLNALDREIVKINTENLDLQADLDRYKSFNNVDSKIGAFKLLQKADRVLEVTATGESTVLAQSKPVNHSSFNWAIGY